MDALKYTRVVSVCRLVYYYHFSPWEPCRTEYTYTSPRSMVKTVNIVPIDGSTPATLVFSAPEKRVLHSRNFSGITRPACHRSLGTLINSRRTAAAVITRLVRDGASTWVRTHGGTRLGHETRATKKICFTDGIFMQKTIKKPYRIRRMRIILTVGRRVISRTHFTGGAIFTVRTVTNGVRTLYTRTHTYILYYYVVCICIRKTLYGPMRYIIHTTYIKR